MPTPTPTTHDTGAAAGPLFDLACASCGDAYPAAGFPAVCSACGGFWRHGEGFAWRPPAAATGWTADATGAAAFAGYRRRADLQASTCVVIVTSREA